MDRLRVVELVLSNNRVNASLGDRSAGGDHAALSLAAANKHASLVRLILDRGGASLDVNRRGADGRSAYDIAMMVGGDAGDAIADMIRSDRRWVGGGGGGDGDGGGANIGGSGSNTEDNDEL